MYLIKCFQIPANYVGSNTLQFAGMLFEVFYSHFSNFSPLEKLTVNQSHISQTSMLISKLKCCWKNCRIFCSKTYSNPSKMQLMERRLIIFCRFFYLKFNCLENSFVNLNRISGCDFLVI